VSRPIIAGIFLKSSAQLDGNMIRGGPFQVTVHPYNSPTRQSCAYESGDPAARNALIFVGGLGDGPQTVDYIRSVSDRLAQQKDLGYSVFEIRMRSSFSGFGTSSLKEDVEDISSLVRYLRDLGREKIVLLGHSTGCQVRAH
jgi:triacylglycerol esterase/lipase EstA (alpha/beta hydrolase family)